MSGNTRVFSAGTGPFRSGPSARRLAATSRTRGRSCKRSGPYGGGSGFVPRAGLRPRHPALGGRGLTCCKRFGPYGGGSGSCDVTDRKTAAGVPFRRCARDCLVPDGTARFRARSCTSVGRGPGSSRTEAGKSAFKPARSVRHQARPVKGGNIFCGPSRQHNPLPRASCPQNIFPSLRDAFGTLDRPFLASRSALARVEGTENPVRTREGRRLEP